MKMENRRTHRVLRQQVLGPLTHDDYDNDDDDDDNYDYDYHYHYDT